MTATFGPVSDYLPHRPPMLLIDHIVEVTDNRAVCRTTIHPDCVFARDGVVHPSAMIEIVAQACAIWVGVTSSRKGGAPQVGFLVACREVAFAVDRFCIGDELTIAVTKVLGEDQLAVFSGIVSRGDEECVTIQLSVVDAERAGAHA
ncbi:3-hydroxy-fatty acyl-ACP dehydratase [soil metagenome]